MPRTVHNHIELKASPTLINCGNLKFLVYASATLAQGPALYFYSLDHGMTVCRISGAEIFIHCFESYDSRCTIISYIEGDEVIQR